MGSILWAIGSAAIPYAKILKWRRFIKEIGSVTEVAELLIKVARGQEQPEELSAVMGGLVSEVLGINAIADNCW